MTERPLLMLENWDGDGRVALGFYHWLDVWGTLENGEAALLRSQSPFPGLTG
jgi:hypothetical protein